MTHVRLLARHRLVPWVLVGILILTLVALTVNAGTNQKAQKQPMTVREILAGYEGSDSNLGKIKRIGTDFLLLQEETTQKIVPIHSIQEVRLMKENPTDPMKIEIRLVAKD